MTCDSVVHPLEPNPRNDFHVRNSEEYFYQEKDCIVGSRMGPILNTARHAAFRW